MYMTNDTEGMIKVIKQYIGKIYESDFIINVNGKLDANTIYAIRKFQSENNINTSNYIDYNTFLAAYEAYKNKVLTEHAKNTFTDIIFPIKMGDQYSGITNVNYMLRGILEYYSIYHVSPSGDYFSNDSKEAVKIIRQVFEIEDGDIIDEIMYLRLLGEWKSISSIAR